jgi:hypothetical protein
MSCRLGRLGNQILSPAEEASIPRRVSFEDLAVVAYVRRMVRPRCGGAEIGRSGWPARFGRGPGQGRRVDGGADQFGQDRSDLCGTWPTRAWRARASCASSSSRVNSRGCHDRGVPRATWGVWAGGLASRSVQHRDFSGGVGRRASTAVTRPLRRLHVWVAGAAVAVWSWVTIWVAWSSQLVSSAAVGASS